MLVLTRKVGQEIKIGDNIYVTILEVKGTADTAQVRVGIAAPHDVDIVRTEIDTPKERD